MSALLTIENLAAGYGEITALHDIGIEVNAGEAVALVGANGAGKSSLMKCLMGLVRPHSGVLRFDGQDLAQAGISARAALGIGYSPEGRRIFPGLTVHENLLVASRERDGGRTRSAEIYRIFPALDEKRHALGWSLSGGQQQMLAIGRALMLAPRLLLLDEPSLGLSPVLTAEVLKRVKSIAETGAAVLLAEQNVHKALTVTRRAYVIRLGRIVAQGASRDLLADEGLQQAFLGA